MKKIQALGLLFCAFFTLNNILFAETIYLKSGEKVKGKITASSSKSIMMDNGNMYSRDEIKEIKRDDDVNVENIKKSITSIKEEATNSNIQNVANYKVISRGGAELNILLPQQWMQVPLVEEAPIATFVHRNQDKKILSIINILDQYNEGWEKYNTPELKKAFLKLLREEFLKTRRGPYAGEWLAEKYGEICGEPCFTVTLSISGSDGGICRRVHFIKNSEMYSFELLTKNKEILDKEWPVVEQIFKTIEIKATTK